MERVYNFSAGPATLPLPVLEKVRKELINHENHGMSVMEMSHRSAMFEEIIQGAEATLRKLMRISDAYSVLFLQGGASLQFAMVPLNLMGKTGKADYVKTGMWAKKAIEQAKAYGEVNVVASSEDETFSYIPRLDRSMFDPGASYVHITTNNTIYGTRYTVLPDTGDVPLVADASSDILAQERDMDRFGLLYAGAQKNIGPAGVTIVIIRRDLIGSAMPITPIMLDYATHDKAGSLYNTPTTFGIYVAKLVFEWLDELGGIKAIEQVNEHKAGLLYDFMDNSSFYTGTVRKEDRSLMCVPFLLPTKELTEKFVREAEANGLVNLKGHRSVGGIRACIYNAMPVEGVQALIGFMKKFESNNR
ncbi:MAG: 3-phosphoserine/phosphohydroxythreonine transaminase [Bacillota bacterium]